MKTFKLDKLLRPAPDKYARAPYHGFTGGYKVKKIPKIYCKFCGELGFPFCSEACKERLVAIHGKV